MLELFLFIHPTSSIAPTLKGICDALDIPLEAGIDARILLTITARLEEQLASLAKAPSQWEIGGLLQVLHRHQWPWRHDLQHLLDNVALSAVDDTLPLKIWRRLPKWEDEAPPPPGGVRPVSRDAALDRLTDIIGKGAETRPAQRDFTSVACEAFQPREAPGMPGLVLAEAGTGTGKTAGYLAPASVWAEKNGGTVWVSTYTRHLQKQIERELHALFLIVSRDGEKLSFAKGGKTIFVFSIMRTASMFSPPDQIDPPHPWAYCSPWSHGGPQ